MSWSIERRRQLAQKLGLTVPEVLAVGLAKAESRAAWVDAHLARAAAVEAAAGGLRGPERSVGRGRSAPGKRGPN